MSVDERTLVLAIVAAAGWASSAWLRHHGVPRAALLVFGAALLVIAFILLEF